MKHKIIKARLKEDRVALTCMEMLDGTMKMGKGTTRALEDWNRKHFQQPIRNGVTAANGGAFSKGLRPHETSPTELHSNTHAILKGILDRNAVQHHELPICNAFCSTTNEILVKNIKGKTRKRSSEITGRRLTSRNHPSHPLDRWDCTRRWQ